MAAKDKMMTQVDLIEHNPMGMRSKGLKTMTTWVNADKRLQKGVVIELKDDGLDDFMWKVVEVYDTRPMSDVDNHGWDNNNYDKHTGLFS